MLDRLESFQAGPSCRQMQLAVAKHILEVFEVHVCISWTSTLQCELRTGNATGSSQATTLTISKSGL